MSDQLSHASYAVSCFYLFIFVINSCFLFILLIKVAHIRQSPREQSLPFTNRKWSWCSTVKCAILSATSPSSLKSSCSPTQQFFRCDFWNSLFHIVQNGGLLSPLTVELLPYLSAFVPFVGVQPWYHTLFCGERQRTAVMRHHTCDSSKLAVLILFALVL